MVKLSKVLEELNKKYSKTVMFRQIFVDSFYDWLINYHLTLGVSFGKRCESSVRLGTRPFFYGLPCNTVANLEVIKQVSGSPWKPDGSFNPNTYWVNEDVKNIIEVMFFES